MKLLSDKISRFCGQIFSKKEKINSSSPKYRIVYNGNYYRVERLVKFLWEYGYESFGYIEIAWYLSMLGLKEIEGSRRNHFKTLEVAKRVVSGLLEVDKKINDYKLREKPWEVVFESKL